MKMNNKGFTLIESIITFAIIALAGGMFLLGFYNVATIASEGSIIKTETNNLYNDVLTQTNTVNTKDIYIKFKLEGNDEEVSIPVNGISKKVTADNGSFDIRFTFFDPILKSEMLSNDSGQEEEQIDFHAEFQLLTSLENLPQSYEKINTNDFAKVGLSANALKSTISERLNEGYIFGESEVNPYILKEIDSNIVQQFINNNLDENYKKWLGNSYHISWICIDFANHSSWTDGIDQYRVYGYLTRQSFSKGVIVVLNDGRIINLDIDTNTNKVDIPDDIRNVLNGNKYIINGEEYEWGKFQQSDFIDGNSDVYIAIQSK